MGERKFGDVERAGLGNDLQRHPLIPQTGFSRDPQDGLPRMVSRVTTEQTQDTQLTPETFVCMGIDDVFVCRDEYGNETLRFSPERVRRFKSHSSADPEWVVPVSSLTQNEREVLDREGEYLSALPVLVVEPLRPPCAHYCRVLTDFEQQSEISHMERVCKAQRSENGEYISLANTRVYACEHRLPRDFVSEDRLRRFDEKLVAKAQADTEPEWDPVAALAASKKPGEKTEP
jgi:hypothetical protein